ncbi:MAG: glutamate--tRNA ligase [Candidatus Binatia bacterium]
MSVRTRFPPSPTGFLHIGGVRTALFNHLFARHHGGTFVLRIEDTDRERSTPESTQVILDGLTWLDIRWDEGPFFQSERTALYRTQAEELLRAGGAYRCWCTPDELDARRKAALESGRQPAYDRSCRARTGAPPGRTEYVLRFKTPLDGETVVDDGVKGRVVFQNAELDDFVILRSDGSPIYNFCVVVDDADMRITDIIRGDDHLTNTPRQILIYRALGASIPRFAHVPMILGLDKARLSKRHGATSVTAYREMGYLPDAMVNYLVRLGWSHGDQELFTREDLVAHFGLESVARSAAVFNPEKLLWVNFQHVKQTSPEELARLVPPFLERAGLPVPTDRTWLARAVATLRERAKTLVELAEQLRIYLAEPGDPDPRAATKHLTAAVLPALDDVTRHLAGLHRWDIATIEAAFQKTLDAHGLALGKLAQPVRVAITGTTVSPGIFELLDVLGQERTVMRLRAALDRLGSLATPSSS